MIFRSILSGAAAILLYTGLLFLTISIRKGDRSIYLMFALVSLCVGLSLVFKLIAIQCSTIPTIMNMLKLDAFLEFLGSAAWIWMVAHYTQVKPRQLLWLISGIYLLLAALNIVLPYGTFWSGIVKLTKIMLPWGESFNYLIGTPHPLIYLGAVNGIAALGFAFYSCFWQYQRGEKRKASILVFSLIWLVISFLHLYLVDLAVLKDFLSISTFPLVFLVMVIIMSLQLADEIVKTESQLRYYNSYLERIVEARTQKLTEAIEQATLLNERNRLAEELHDSVNQTLHSLVMIADSLPKLWENHREEIPLGLQKIKQMAQGSLTQMRNLLSELCPQRL